MKACAAKIPRGGKAFLLLLISLLQASGSLERSPAGAAEPSRPSGTADDTDPVHGLLVFRVSEAFVRNELEREIKRCSPVDRTIEGTRSRGTAETTAQLTLTLEPQNDGIAFAIVGRGIINTNTVGRNRSVTLHCNLQTPFTAHVSIRFDGTQFERSDLALQSNSRLRILSIRSDQPGFRGRLITKVASRRAAESLPRVQAISGHLTEQELRKSIADSVDESLQKLNDRMQTRRLLPLLMRTTQGRWLRYSSSTDALRVAWYPLLNAGDVPRCPLERGDDAAVQLWVHDRWATALGIDELPKITEDFESWLQVIIPNAALMENIPLPRILPLPPIRLERVEAWYVIEVDAG